MMTGDDESGGGKKLPISVEVGLAAKAELKGEIPSSSLGRLVDAFTDAIRPFTERRGLKADLLRLQREEVAIEIAKRARSIIAEQGGHANPVPNKLLVPILERGSCENISDEVMIDRWADLLASASQELPVPPRFPGILDELAGQQAACLEYIAFGNSEGLEFPFRDFSDSPYNYADYVTRTRLGRLADVSIKRSDSYEEALNPIMERLLKPGVFPQYVSIGNPVDENDFACYDYVQATGVRRDADVAILESLGLIRSVVLQMEVERELRSEAIDVEVHYSHLTELGVFFCEVCCRSAVQRLKAIDHRNRPAHTAST